MSEPHVPTDLLVAFIDGEVDEQVAIHIAEHIDGCPVCANRAASAEPMTHVFARVADPVPPPQLAASIMAKLAQPEAMPELTDALAAEATSDLVAETPRVEVTIGLALLGSAALLGAYMGDPVSLAVDASVLINVLAKAGVAANGVVVSSTLALSFTLMAATLSTAAAVLSTVAAQSKPDRLATVPADPRI